jgi:hypothetical protein
VNSGTPPNVLSVTFSFKNCLFRPVIAALRREGATAAIEVKDFEGVIRAGRCLRGCETGK